MVTKYIRHRNQSTNQITVTIFNQQSRQRRRSFLRRCVLYTRYALSNNIIYLNALDLNNFCNLNSQVYNTTNCLIGPAASYILILSRHKNQTTYSEWKLSSNIFTSLEKTEMSTRRYLRPRKRTSMHI